MTIESVLLSGVSAVTAGLVYVANLLWQRANQCEADRYETRKAYNLLQIQVGDLKRDVGKLEGELISYRNCYAVTCPFKDKMIKQ